MNGKLKLLLGGLGIGLLFVFALMGVKSLMVDDTPKAPATTDSWSQQPAVTHYSGNIANVGATDGEKVATQRDVTRPETPSDKVNPSLIGEKPVPEVDQPTTSPNTTTPPPTTTPPSTTTPPATNTARPGSNVSTGSLEILAQSAEDNKPIAASIYVQKTDGTNVDAAAATAQTVFNLKAGLYKVSVRANGRASVTRNITVPPKASVSEIFALPLTAQTPVATPTPEPSKPPVDEQDEKAGKLRVVALSADDGSPLKVDFTVRELDGTILNRVKNVSMAEMTLPAQEVIVSFTFRDFTGEQSLVIKPKNTTSHTFNLRGVNNQPEDKGVNNPAPNTPNNAGSFNEFLNGMQNPPRN